MNPDASAGDGDPADDPDVDVSTDDVDSEGLDATNSDVTETDGRDGSESDSRDAVSGDDGTDADASTDVDAALLEQADWFARENLRMYCEAGRQCANESEGTAWRTIFCHRAFLDMAMDSAGWIESIADGTMVFRPEAAHDCVEAMEALVGAGDCLLADEPEVCDSVTGHVPLGGECTSDKQCMRGSRCDQELTCAGVCRPHRSPDGELCHLALRCEERSFCNALERCEPRAEIGEACGVDKPCVPDAYCLSTGVCAAVGIGGGEPCEPPGRTGLMNPCASGLYCDPERGLCVLGPGLGEPCAREVPCAEDGHVCWSNRCQLAVPEGHACSEDANRACETNFACSGGVCTPFPMLGEPCDDELWCSVGTCGDDGVCVPRANRRCSYDAECIAGWVCNDGDCVPPGEEDDPCESDESCADGYRCQQRRPADRRCTWCGDE